jgi:hypothetical protein
VATRTSPRIKDDLTLDFQRKDDLMKASLLCSSILILILASGAAQAADKYEGVAIQGTSKDLPSFFQINVTTGGTTSVWGNTSTGQFSVQDKAPLPSGSYHLFASFDPAADGTMTWMVNRLDGNSGRIWVLTGGGSTPLAWMEVLPTK